MRLMAIPKKHNRRRGTVIAQVAVMSTLMMGIGALAIDVGAMYTVQAELQAMADSAALAAASQLVGDANTDIEYNARVAAEEFGGRNKAAGSYGGISISSDVEFGKAVYDPSTERFVFNSGDSPVDAVRVTARRSEGSLNGPLQLMFANALGRATTNLEAQAAATLVPRDMMVVIDLSRSMLYDSRLKRVFEDCPKDDCVNLRDIWAALDGPCPSIPYVPACEQYSEYAGDTGPMFGLMDQWGDPLNCYYNATSDPGLFYIPRYGTTSDARIVASLQARGYSAEEQDALLQGPEDGASTSYRNRVAVLLGLAEWQSGKEDGKFGTGVGGNGNNYVGDSETTGWESFDGSIFTDLTWGEYIDSVRDGRASDRHSWGGYRYYYGLKTFTDFILERRYSNADTPTLFCTPQQPLRAVKDGVQALTDYLLALESPDQLGVADYATDAPSAYVHILTENLQAIPDKLYSEQVSHWGQVSTNIGAGMGQAFSELQSSRARNAAKKIMVVLSDGVANTGDDGMGGKDFARWQAERAADEGIIIYAISVGDGVDRAFMQELAAIGRGQEFYAHGNPEEYTEELQAIFRSLGGKRPVVMIQ